jgi:hypothetical protein
MAGLLQKSKVFKIYKYTVRFTPAWFSQRLSALDPYYRLSRDMNKSADFHCRKPALFSSFIDQNG